MMQERSPVAVDFDANEDVLYITLGSPVPSYADETDDGLLLRYSLESDAPSGVTVVGAHLWAERQRALARRVAAFMHADARELESAIRMVVFPHDRS